MAMLALAGASAWLALFLAGPPSDAQALTCELGGACAAAYTRAAASIVGIAGCFVALVAGSVAVVRVLRARRDRRVRGQN